MVTILKLKFHNSIAKNYLDCLFEYGEDMEHYMPCLLYSHAVIMIAKHQNCFPSWNCQGVFHHTIHVSVLYV
jgi:hypothetical protein